MQKSILILGSVILLLAVALGAFGAHGLQSIVSAKAVGTFKTGVQYQFYHGFAILIVGILMQILQTPKLKIAAYLFAIGILLFSGSLYVLTFNEVANIPFVFGPLTPIGGLCFMAGWIAMIVLILRNELQARTS